ncbi:MAG: glycoside hydrolase, partial [Prevotella sp.]|nr:glycoside hydrolase [Prevotella sp.]
MKRLSALLSLMTIYLMATAQTVHWITADDSLVNQQNSWIEFRKDFALKKKPKKAEAKIAADTKYWLWVNGELAVFEGGLKRGPNRTDSYYDLVDLAPWLKKGKNDVRLLLWHFGKPGFSHVNSGRAGVIVDAPSIGLSTDRTWQSQRLAAYQTCDKPYANFRLPESNIRYDARLLGQNDQKPSIEIGQWG